MKTLWSLIPSAVKAIAQVVIFFISLGWLAYGAVILIVKAEGNEIRKELYKVRSIDKEHFDDKFEGVHKRFDEVIKEIKKQ